MLSFNKNEYKYFEVQQSFFENFCLKLLLANQEFKHHAIA